jgi:LPS O-antigen subunit length determinant protein (WzzB/FepE family)
MARSPLQGPWRERLRLLLGVAAGVAIGLAYSFLSRALGST